MPKKRAKSKSSSAPPAKKDKASAGAVKARRQTAAVLVVETLGEDAQGKLVYTRTASDKDAPEILEL